MDRLKIAMYDYMFDNECFPLELPDCDQSFEGGGNVYLVSMPCDMQGNPYVYVRQNSDCPIWFRIFTRLEIEDDSSIETSGCNWGCGPECAYNYGVTSTNTKANIGCVSYYVCPPRGGNKDAPNTCEIFEDPIRSNCPRVWKNDPTCGGIMCQSKDGEAYRCANSSGKTIPKEVEFY